jgi:hypothetical protein
VKVIAYPVPKDNDLILSHKNGIISSSPDVADLSHLFDGDTKTGITFPNGETFIIDFNANEAFTARSLTIQSTENRMNANVLLQAQNEKGDYTTT